MHQNYAQAIKGMCQSTGIPEPVVAPETVGEHLDRQIKAAREMVEQLCIVKARAETCNLLNYPANELRKMVGYGPF